MTDHKPAVCDVVMLAWSKTAAEYAMTCEAVRTLRASSAGHINLVVVETNANLNQEPWCGPDLFGDADVHVAYPYRPFGYNDFILCGLSELPGPPSPHVMVVNNDMVFQAGCIDRLVDALQRFDSVSPRCPRRHAARIPAGVAELPGWHVGTRVCGWALMFKRSAMDRIGRDVLFPPQLRGWWQDIWYADRMREAGFKHAMVWSAVAEHLGSKSLNLLSVEDYADLTDGQQPVYDRLSREHRLKHRKAPPPPKVLVAVCTHNRPENVQRWLRAWTLCDRMGGHLLIVNNGPDPLGIDYLPNASEFRRGNAGMNIGALRDVIAGHLGWDILLWCDDDNVPMRRDFLHAFIDKFQAQRVGLVGNQLMRRGDLPELPDMAEHVRTSCFAIRREVAAQLVFPDQLVSKEDTLLFEYTGGDATMYQQVLRMPRAGNSFWDVAIACGDDTRHYSDCGEWVWDSHSQGNVSRWDEFDAAFPPPRPIGKRLVTCVYAIAKNEAKHVARWLAPLEHHRTSPDLIVVADTGSGDGTADLLRAGGAAVHHISVDPWRFDTARNAALSLIPPDVDVCLSVDLDEVLPDNWLALLEAAWTPGTVQGSYVCNTAFDDDDKPTASFIRNNIHARNGFMWKYPIHEAVEYIGDPDKYKCVVIDGLATNHKPDGKPRPQYLPLLTAAVKSDPCPRNLYYLTRELYYREVWEQLAVLADDYLKLVGEDPAERSAVMRWKALAHLRLGQTDEADRWFYRSVAEDPGRREPWVALSRFHVLHGRWEEGYAAAKRALAITERPVHHLTDPDCWGTHPQELADRCTEKLGIGVKAKPTHSLWAAVVENPVFRVQVEKMLSAADKKSSRSGAAAV